MADTSSLYYHSDLPQSPNIVPRLGIPGTPHFFASLLEFIRVTAPDVPLDPVIFQAIVLCVMAGNKHVLLRPREEDVAIVQNLAALIFADIFGYATHKHRISPSSGSIYIPPSSFVPSIFSSPYQGAPTSRMTSSSRMRAKRSQSHSTSDDHRRHGRQASEVDVSSSSSHRERANTKSGIPFRNPFHAPGTRFESTESESPRVLHRSSSTSLLPTAVVVTGLEHSSLPCHRALLRTLLENRVAFDDDPGGAKYASWDLPEDFVVVYVCPFDPRERPSIHKSLLDKFSLSVPVALHPTTRQAHTAYLALQSSGTRSPSQVSTPAQQPTTPILPRDLLPRLRSLSTEAPDHVNIHASLRLYIADLIGAARRHHELDGTLLGARCVQDAEALVRAHCVLGSGDVGSALIERAAALPAPSARSSASLHDGGAEASVHLQWARMEPSVTSLPSRSDASGGEANWLYVDPRESWDVSEVDVAKVVPRVISHRLQVRDGPEDEMIAGVVHLATAPRVPAGVESNEGVWRRRTIKEILVKLIGEV